jgi:hypothetical protein
VFWSVGGFTPGLWLISCNEHVDPAWSAFLMEAGDYVLYLGFFLDRVRGRGCEIIRIRYQFLVPYLFNSCATGVPALYT